MKLTSLKGELFRNINAINIHPSPFLNLIDGNNGSGKSTLLEMIYCLSRGRSFRVNTSAPMIQYEQAYCSAFAQLESADFSTSIGFRKDKYGKTQLKIGLDKQQPTHRSLSELLPIQLFHPESHNFLTGGPSLRRKFIDWGLFYTEPYFIEQWQRFHQLLKQRNAALSQQQLSTIAAWDIELANVGEMLSQYRSRYVKQLINYAHEWLVSLVGKCIKIQYHPGWTNGSLFDQLKNNLSKDTKYGYTTQGPHRFDLLIQCHGVSVTDSFSRGEQKRLICALYLAQGKLFEEARQKGCVYLFDDILSELDVSYQAKVLDALTGLNAQVFVTSLAASVLQPLLSIKETKQFHLVDGVVHS